MSSPFEVPDAHDCSWEVQLRDAVAHIALVEDSIRRIVEHAHGEHGISWSEIGSVLGVTRQAARQRFSR